MSIHRSLRRVWGIALACSAFIHVARAWAQELPSNPVPAEKLAPAETPAPAEKLAPAEKPDSAGKPAAAETPAPMEVTVKGTAGEGRRRQQSAEAVTVVEMRRAKQQSSDLGEVLARTQGVSVRRSGGLGSSARFSLNGLYDDQIRYFLDGVPLAAAGYPFGIANVPVNLIERVEIYRGVVPLRFGADALGGAVNLVTDTRFDSHARASYQVGSFGTHRVSVDGRYRHEPSGLVAGGSIFFDDAKNNYRIDVEATDDRGRLHPVNVPRFHDRYVARGASVEVGVVDRPWARRLLLRAYGSSYDKELQHNVVMTVPYGEVEYGESVYGAVARYEQPLTSRLELKVLASYSRRTIDFVDKSDWSYDWYGRKVSGPGTPRTGTPGEIQEDAAYDQTQREGAGLARAALEWTVAPSHVLRMAVAPTWTARTGQERIPSNGSAPNPVNTDRGLFTLVSGVEYEANLLGERLQNIAFVKDYVFRVSSSGAGSVAVSRDAHSLGAGDAVRFRVSKPLYVKLSYEYATRLPSSDEVFGNGVLARPNLALEPETSHNANAGPRLELRHTPIGDITADVNVFYRDSDRLILPLAGETYVQYQNVHRARSFGLENALTWATFDHRLTLDGTLTVQDARNASSEGTYGHLDGDRLPNRPWLFASWGARFRIPGLPSQRDALEPFYMGRFVHEFYRGWPSLGAREYKPLVPSQITHNVGVSYTAYGGPATVTSTLEVQNVTDERVYDFFGVQRPGRAVYLKVSGEI
ncbi:TonB-dependent siderophore myxochelin receptor MxcH [Pendulispora albinea]|uniref:TonB-dependent siderophore myxochelin receptor MxcH n=1 Tax=Pendulispora albinea TaxID=2741071 RepID=A0ABZ2M7F3_9BACT